MYKGYRIVGLGTFPMFRIQPQGSGSIPKALWGNYTSKILAEKAVDLYLNSLIKRGKKNDKKKELSSS